MNTIKRLYCRTYQFLMNKIFIHFISIKEPKVIDDQKDLSVIAKLLQERGLSKPFILLFTDCKDNTTLQEMIEKLQEEKINFRCEIAPAKEPTVDTVNMLYHSYLEHKSDSIIAVGGGTVLDLSKAVGILAKNKNKDISHYRGLLKVRKKLPFFIAVPTTAGTGSETTICSVISDEKNDDKYAINSPKIVPDYAILCHSLLKTLPKEVIATTGMDALTHAVEAFLGNATTKKTREYSLKAIKLIYENLLNFYHDPKDSEACNNMLKASFLAGLAFTRSYVGYVHALAHAIGGKYHVPHGKANSILLPIVLKEYMPQAEKKLSYIKQYINLPVETDFISYIEKLNKEMNIPSSFEGVIKDEDISSLASHAEKEANPLYPVIKLLFEDDLKRILVKANRN